MLDFLYCFRDCIHTTNISTKDEDLETHDELTTLDNNDDNGLLLPRLQTAQAVQQVRKAQT